MADIKQAAKWMKQEKKVRRKSDPLNTYNSWAEHFGGAVNESRCESIDSFARLTVTDLLANDWEVAE